MLKSAICVGILAAATAYADNSDVYSDEQFQMLDETRSETVEAFESCNRMTKIIMYDPKSGKYFHPCDKHLYMNDNEETQAFELQEVGGTITRSISRPKYCDSGIRTMIVMFDPKTGKYFHPCDKHLYVKDDEETQAFELQEVGGTITRSIKRSNKKRNKRCNRLTKIVMFDPKSGKYFHPCDKHLYMNDDEKTEAFELKEVGGTITRSISRPKYCDSGIRTKIIMFDRKTGRYFHPCDKHLYVKDDEETQAFELEEVGGTITRSIARPAKKRCNRFTKIIRFDPKSGKYFHPCDKHLYMNDNEQAESFELEDEEDMDAFEVEEEEEDVESFELEEEEEEEDDMDAYELQKNVVRLPTINHKINRRFTNNKMASKNAKKLLMKMIRKAKKAQKNKNVQ